MKKLFALLLALCLLLTFAACGEPEESKAPNNDKPGATTTSPSQPATDTPTVSRIIYERNTNLNGGAYSETRYVYDDRGILLQKLEISNGDEANAMVYTVECDAHGNPVKETCGEQVITYTYDEQGNLLQLVMPRNTITYRYDENGRVESSTSITGDITIEQRYIRENDVRVTTEYYLNGVLTQLIHYTYDEQGRIARQDICSTDESLLSYAIHTYTDTENGYKQEMTTYNADGTPVQTLVKEYANYPAL